MCGIHHHRLKEITAILVIAILGSGLLFGITPETRANGPIPFSADFAGFTGSGFAPNPDPGQLDSNVWIVTGLSDGGMNFGDTQTSGDFSRGVSIGDVTAGGVYAFDVGGNIVFGIQPATSDFTPGEIILRLQNNTGSTVTQLNVTYEIWYRNDQPRANSLNFYYSPDNSIYTPVPTLDFTTPQDADTLGWQSALRSTTLTELNIANDGLFYLKWAGDDISGAGSRDEYGLDNLQITVLPDDTLPSIVSTSPIDGASAVTISTNIELNFSEAVTVIAPWFNIDCTSSGDHPAIVSGGPQHYTLDPEADFEYDETCIVIIFAAQVTGQDGPSDNMGADYIFSFNTAFVPSPTDPVLISEFLYDGLIPSSEGDEFLELCNPNPEPVNLTGYKIGDEETKGGNESMYQLPADTILATNACLVIAKNAVQFQTRFGFLPDLEVIVSGSSYNDHPTVPNLVKYSAWGKGNWALANSGDEILVLGPGDEVIDSVAYRNGDYAGLQLEPDASAPEPHSLQRVWPIDTDSMPHDFVRTEPTASSLTVPPSPPPLPAPPAVLPDDMFAYWGDLHAHTTYSDGAGPPYYALAMARAAGLHFFAITDHGWRLSPDQWDNTQGQTISATVPGEFIALRGVEWTHQTDGHINIFNSDTLLRRTDPAVDTLTELYAWLAANPAAIAQFNHPGANYDGYFNIFPFDGDAAPFVSMQEIGNNGRGYFTYEAAFIQSNTLGWRVGPTNNSDVHTAKWGIDSPTRTGIVAPALSQADLLEAMRARRVFATEDSNLALALRLDEAWMGSVMTATDSLSLTVDFVDPDPEPLTLFLYDSNLPLATIPLTTSTGQWTTTVTTLPGHYYWVKAVQADGDTAYSAPVWIEGQAPADTVYINEMLPAPSNWDWDGDGVADHRDEFIELFNPLDRPIGLGGWQVSDTSRISYDIPLGTTIPAAGFVTLFQAQTQFSLNNDGDSVTLTRPNGAIVDSFTYAHSPGYDETWCRLPDGHSHWSDNCGPSPNASNWEKAPTGPFEVKIYDAKRLSLGAWVRVKGRVTAPPPVFGYRTMYIQDETAGIQIYLPKEHGLYFNLGDKVEVEGNLRSYHEELEIAVNERSDVKSLAAGLPPPPLPIATTSLLEPYEGMLVMLQGQAVHFKGWSTMWLDDGTDWAKVYIRSSTGIRKPYIEMGTPVTVVGIASQYSDEGNPLRDDYRLLPRYQTDLVLPTPPQSPVDWPTLLPETGEKEREVVKINPPGWGQHPGVMKGGGGKIKLEH